MDMNIFIYQINLKKKKVKNLLNEFISELNCKISNIDKGLYSYSFDVLVSIDNIQNIINIISQYQKKFNIIDEFICIGIDIRF